MEASFNETIDHRIKDALRRFSDFPKPGIQFVDIFPIFRHSQLLHAITDELAKVIRKCPIKVTCVAALEARGFLFGPLVAVKLGIKFVPVRKEGKLPGPVAQFTYDLEYGKDTVEIQNGALSETDIVVVLDDILATGGTAKAAVNLVKSLNVNVALCLFVMEFAFLDGRRNLERMLEEAAGTETAVCSLCVITDTVLESMKEG